MPSLDGYSTVVLNVDWFWLCLWAGVGKERLTGLIMPSQTDVAPKAISGWDAGMGWIGNLWAGVGKEHLQC